MGFIMQGTYRGVDWVLGWTAASPAELWQVFGSHADPPSQNSLPDLNQSHQSMRNQSSPAVTQLVGWSEQADEATHRAE